MKNTMKRIGSLFAMAIMVALFTFMTNAEYDDFQYEVLEDGTVSITGYIGSDVNVRVPNEINDNKVTKIADSAFWGKNYIESITISDGITDIGNYAFCHCINLESISIPSSITSIGDITFGECFSIKEIVVDIENLFYSSSDGVLFNKEKTCLIQYPVGSESNYYDIPFGVLDVSPMAFAFGVNLERISVPWGVETIPEGTFYFCTSLKEIFLPESLKKIETSAFESCFSLKGITIPNSVLSIDRNAFFDCFYLERMVIEGASTSIGDRTVYASAEILDGITSKELNKKYKNYINVLIESKENEELLKQVVDDFTSVLLPFGNSQPIANIIIYGYSDSFAENYALNNNIRFEYISDSTTIATGECGAEGDNVSFTLYNNGDLIIYGTGEMIDYNDGVITNPWYVYYRDRIKKVDVTGGVTKIGSNNFCDLDKLESIIIGSDVSYIAESALFDNDSLQEIIVSDYNENFCCDEYGVLFNKDKTLLIQYPTGNGRKEYYIPESVVIIGIDSFCSCLLVTVHIPESVIELKTRAFSSCALLDFIKIPDSVKIIGDNAFSFCDFTTSIELGNGIEKIGYRAFADCYRLKKINIPTSVEYISEGAFASCWSITEIKLPENLTVLNDGTFDCCERLQKVTISNNITEIGRYAFGNCVNITDVYYSGSQAEWNEISIDSSNVGLSNATIHYNSTGPSDNPNSGDNLNKVTIDFTNDTYEVEVDDTVTVSATVTCPAGVDNSNLDMIWEVIDPDGTEIVLEGEYSRSETEWACYAEIRGLKGGTYYINLRDNNSTVFDTVRIDVYEYYHPQTPPKPHIDCDDTTVEYKQNVDFDKRKKFTINGEITNYNEEHTLTDISITIKSPDANKAVFKTEDGYKDSVTFPLGKTVETGKSRDFKCTAYIKRGYNPPNGTEDLTFTCILHGKLNGTEVNGIYKTFNVKIKNLSYENPDDNKNWTPTTMIGLLDFLFTSRDPKGVRYIDRYPGDGRFNFDRLQLQSQYDSIKAMGAVKSTIELSDELSKRLDVAIKLTELGNISAIKIQDVVLGIGEEALDQVMDAYQDKAMEEFSKYYNKYIKDLLESDVFEHYLKWYSDEVNYINGNSTKVTKRCPIDIFVTDEEGCNILKIEDSNIEVYDEYASAYLTGDDKILYLPNDIGHSIKTIATDNGEMDYIIESYSKQGEYRIMEYNNIPLTKGKSYTATVPLDMTSNIDMFNPKSEDGKIIKADKDETEHRYGEKDKNCQLCGYDRTEGCSCKCHKTNFFTKLIWKITIFFNKLFKKNRLCDCGMAHY